MVEFEWYVLNEDRMASSEFDKFPYSGGKIRPWNIFNNVRVYEHTLKLCKEYKTKHMEFNEFVEELRKIIHWQECGRCEYEIYVSTHFSDELKRVDCYQQVLPNIRILAEYVLKKYYPRIKL